MDALFKIHIHDRVFRTMLLIRVKICSMNLKIHWYYQNWPMGNALYVLQAFRDEIWRGRVIIGMHDEGIPDRNDGQYQTRRKVVKIFSIFVGGLQDSDY